MFQRIIKRGSDLGHWRSGRISSFLSATELVVNHDFYVAAMKNANEDTPDSPATPTEEAPDLLLTMGALPIIRDAAEGPDRQNLILRMLKVCSICFDFSNPTKSVREKEIKRHILADLVDYIQSGAGKLSESNQAELVRMISQNIFRSLPPASHENTAFETIDPDDDNDPFFHPSWPHLQLVYELLLRYVTSPDTNPRVARRHIDTSFILNLLELFESEDPREREYLKTIVHRIYGRFMAHRPFIRKAINNIFYRFIYETQRHSGIGDLLEILGSIINGFALPMREEHRIFLVHVLIPLHKPKSMVMYHRQLSYCIRHFVEKDGRLAETIITGLLKQWPVVNSHKEALFLGEIEEVLEVTRDVEFRKCAVPLFKRIAHCLGSPHYQVAERALSRLNNEQIVDAIVKNPSVILPMIFGPLELNVKWHWNQGIREISADVPKMFEEKDPGLYEECKREWEARQVIIDVNVDC